MATLFEKLNLKDHAEILVLNPPGSFETTLGALKGIDVHRRIRDLGTVQFALVFVTRQAEVDRFSKRLVAKAGADALLWFVYPKGTSKKYTCDFNRDNGWKVLRGLGFDRVRQVAIDEDWSALRFRRAGLIKRSTR
jgi:hypothetical protein